MIAAAEPARVWAAGRTLGEGGWWSVAEQALYWLDIKDPAILRFTPATGERAIWPMPEMIGCLAPVSGGGFIAGFASGIYRLTLGAPGTPPERTLVHRPEGHEAHDRFNDGKAHPDGSFWAGTMDDREEEVRGHYFRVSTSGETQRVAGPYKVTNGPAFSPDGRIAFLDDSAAQTVWKLDLQTEGAKPQPFLRFREEHGYPDGCTTDAEGRLWIAFWDGARVACFDPETGEELAVIAMPTDRPTTVSFGGPDLATLYITTARAPEGSAHPDPGGDLYAVAIQGARGWRVPDYRPAEELP